MSRPTLLDLFCGAGGAAMGYHRAGFDVWGMDIKPQPRYPFPFRQGDALEFLATEGHRFDVIHASPPCQAYSATKSTTRDRGHPMLIEPTRALLKDFDGLWVIENVPGAPMINPLTLCGAEFDLTATDVDGTQLVLKRHRLFESNVTLVGKGGCACRAYRKKGYRVAGAYGGGSTDRRLSGVRGGYTPSALTQRTLLDVPWMRDRGTQQAIPPAYTEHIGRQLLAAL